MHERLDIAFPSGDGQCVAWLYPGAPDAGTVPCVVMAHGFGACKEGRLDAFAERFVAAGMAALVFDYRHFGCSSGEPAQLVDIGRQHEDWQAAVAHARRLDGVDPDRIALWGSSFSGGHVVWVAARDPRIAAAVSQVPYASGPATLVRTGPGRLARLVLAGLRDQVGGLLGHPHYVPIVGPEGSLAAMTADDADRAYPALYPEGFEFRNEVPARVGLRLGTYSPGREARRVRCPLLVLVGERDTITPPGPARRMAERAPRGELASFFGAHFEVYRGERFEWAAGLATDFLRRSLGIA